MRVGGYMEVQGACQGRCGLGRWGGSGPSQEGAKKNLTALKLPHNKLGDLFQIYYSIKIVAQCARSDEKRAQNLLE